MQLATQHSLLAAEPGSLVPHVGRSGWVWAAVTGCSWRGSVGVRYCRTRTQQTAWTEGPCRLGRCGQTARGDLWWDLFCGCLNLPVKNPGLINPTKANLARGMGGMSSQWEFWDTIREAGNKFLVSTAIAQAEGKNQARNDCLISPFEFRSVVLMPGLSLASKQLRLRLYYHWWWGQSLIDLSRSDLDQMLS